MKYILTHCCDNENCEPQIFDNENDAITGMIHKVKEIAQITLKNEWLYEELPEMDQDLYDTLVETGHIERENKYKIKCFQFDVLEIFPVEYPKGV